MGSVVDIVAAAVTRAQYQSKIAQATEKQRKHNVCLGCEAMENNVQKFI